MPRPSAHPIIYTCRARAILLAVLLPALLSMPDAVRAQTAPAGTDQAPPAKTSGKSVPTAPAKPLWSELSLLQRQALSPLASRWDTLDETQKQKWLVISDKFETLKPAQQIRLQERMRDWAKLTPEQRRDARENYSRAKKLDPSRKSAEWEQYQQLPEETRRKLAAEAAAKNRVANLPPPSANKNGISPPKKGSQEKPKAVPQGPSAAPPTAPRPGAPASDSEMPPSSSQTE